MYPGTTFRWHDNSSIPTINNITETDDPKVLFLTGFSSDKGTEKPMRISGNDFYSMYVNKADISFEKHGQPLLQASRIIDAGGELFCKRVVGDDATLSNIILTAVVTKKENDTNYTLTYEDPTNAKIYADKSLTEINSSSIDESVKFVRLQGSDTGTSETNNYPFDAIAKLNSSNTSYEVITDDSPEDTRAMTFNEYMTHYRKQTITGGSTVKWEIRTVTNAINSDDVLESAESLIDEDNGVYPILAISDIGRNNDCKSIRIAPSYTISKNLSFVAYSASVLENGASIESATCCLKPDTVYNGTAYTVYDETLSYLDMNIVESGYNKYINKLSEYLSIDSDTLMSYDVIFGCNKRGVAIDGFDYDTDSIDISTNNGIKLQSGSNGTAMGDKPFGTTEYSAKLVEWFSGEFSEEIFDVDRHKISVCCDANYDKSVKDAIVSLANFRQDFVFLRDLGTGLTTYTAIISANSQQKKSTFVGTYLTSFKVKDPISMKRIDVTCMYDIAPLVVPYFNTNPAVPLAGSINGMVLTNAIPGTVNFIPINTPSVNQKELLDDEHINYATYYEYGGDLVLQSTFSSQDVYTQLSYINNVTAIQQIIRDIRTNCPKNRFAFQSGNDFSEYKEMVDNILSAYKSNFSVLELVYQEDPIYAAQKIFYASLNFKFNNWAQSETFDIYALSTSTSNVTE